MATARPSLEDVDAVITGTVDRATTEKPGDAARMGFRAGVREIPPIDKGAAPSPVSPDEPETTKPVVGSGVAESFLSQLDVPFSFPPPRDRNPAPVTPPDRNPDVKVKVKHDE